MTDIHTPHHKGDTAVAVVESLNHDGQGVAHINGKAVFIDGALPGETVNFRYHNKFRTYDTARVLQVIEQTRDRTTPRCPHFGVCGGCSLQYMRPEAQLREKSQILRDAFQRIGKVEPMTWMTPIVGPEWAYRRRARLGVRFVPKKGGVLVGFRERRKSYITPLSVCEVLEPGASALLPLLHELISGLSCPNRIPQIEVAVGENARSLVFRHLVPFTSEDIEALAVFGKKTNTQIYAQAGDIDSIVAVWPNEPETLFYTLPDFDIRIEFHPTDFVQVNSEINRGIVNAAVELLDVKRSDSVLDLFCGLGNFSLPLARGAKCVTGYESDVKLLKRAKKGAEFNAIKNVVFHSADLYQECDILALSSRLYDKWLLDPPRTGAIDVLKQISDVGPPSRILYVSCNPATLARDSALLVHTKGYRLTSAGIADMFPHTSHIEALAVFDRVA